MTGFSRVLAETAPRIGPALSPLHFRYFCDKLAVSLCPRFYEYIFRCPCLLAAMSASALGCGACPSNSCCLLWPFCTDVAMEKEYKEALGGRGLQPL